MFFAGFTLSVHAGVLKAEGFGSSEAEARANAAAELSFMIYSDVRSKLHTQSDSRLDASEQIVEKQVDITSALPIYGAGYKTEADGGYFRCTAVLDAASAVPAYLKEIDRAVSNINSAYAALGGEKADSGRYTYAMSMMAHFENLDKMRAAVNVLGGEVRAYPDVTYEQVKNERDRLSYRTDSMKHAASLIAAELKKPNIYIYYPMFRGSDEVTQFSEVFRDMLSAVTESADYIYNADYFLETDYFAGDGGLYLTSTLTDKSGVTLGKSVKMLTPEAYAGLDTEPGSISFEKLLKLGLAESSDFKARISTKNGKKAMLYKSGDAVEIFIKLNRPGYIFLAGHVDKDGERFSYLVDFYQAHGDRKFVRRIDADETNRWVSIGEFDVVPPFGLETFQMIATVKDPVGMIPTHVFDPETELYIVSKDIKEGVVKTRALKRKEKDVNAAAEDVLIFSTIEK